MKYFFRKFLNSKGMTLIEIMIVVAIIGGVMGLGAYIMFPGDDQKLRDEATRLAGTIKFVYNEAAIKNKYFRIAFDLDERTYRVESSTEPYYVSTEEAPAQGPSAGKGAPAKAETAEGGAEGGTPVPVPEFTEEAGYLIKPVKLVEGVKFKDIFVFHAQDRRETGKVEAYFLPNGWAERMIINLSDEEEESFYSLEVNPVTGRAKIRGEYFEIKPEDFRPEEEPL